MSASLSHIHCYYDHALITKTDTESSMSIFLAEPGDKAGVAATSDRDN